MNSTAQLVEHYFRHEYGRLVALLTSHLGVRHLELAEDVVQSALSRALVTWPRSGTPTNPSAWLYRTARNLAIDALRKQKLDRDVRDVVIVQPDDSQSHSTNPLPGFDNEIGDETLRLLFLCCHPAITADSQMALALKMLEQSGQVQSQLVAHDPGNSLNVIVLADIFLSHSDALWESKQYEQALEKVEQAIPLLDQLLVTSPANVLGAENRHFAAVKRAECLTKLGRFEESKDEWTIALRLAPPMMKETTQVGTATTSIIAGQFVEGTRLIDEILTGHDSDHPVQNQLLARCSAAFALAARQAWSQSDLPDNEPTGEFYALRAIELLGQFQQRTCGKGRFIHDSADLDCLRDRADFRALLVAARNME